jgi:hypothetical protein
MHTLESVAQPGLDLCPACSDEERTQTIAEVLRRSGLVATVKVDGPKKQAWWSRLLNWLRAPWH